jgi:type VI secretion system secreted protein Hcp
MGFHGYASFQGTKQGQIKGESIAKGREKWIEILAFEYGIKSPFDASSGPPTGKRQHSPITITKEHGPASPSLFQACTTNEILKSVDLEFTRPSGTGQEVVYQTVKLTNTTISSVERYTGSIPKGSTPGGRYENVTFQYQDQVVSGGAGLLIPLGQIKRFGKWG